MRVAQFPSDGVLSNFLSFISLHHCELYYLTLYSKPHVNLFSRYWQVLSDQLISVNFTLWKCEKLNWMCYALILKTNRIPRCKRKFKTWLYTFWTSLNMAQSTMKSPIGVPLFWESGTNPTNERQTWFCTFKMAVMAKENMHVDLLLRLKPTANCLF